MRSVNENCVYTYIGDRKGMSDYHSDMQRERCREQGDDSYAGHLGIMPDGVELADCKPFSSAGEAVVYLEKSL